MDENIDAFFASNTYAGAIDVVEMLDLRPSDVREWCAEHEIDTVNGDYVLTEEEVRELAEDLLDDEEEDEEEEEAE